MKKTSRESIQSVVNYYHNSRWQYRLFTYNLKSMGMHMGFWNKSTKNRHDAINLENQAVIDLAKIGSKDLVLDAGCGVGGTSIYIAKHTGAKVIGITITPSQVELAKRYAQKHGVSHLTEFYCQDYTATTFSNKHFDVIYGIESVCHASPKSAFLDEAYRLLKPHGRLVILDGYLSRETKTAQEKKVIADFQYGFALDEFITATQMSKEITRAGFTHLRGESKVKDVLPSIRYYTWLERTFSPLVALSQLIPLAPIRTLRQNAIALRNIGLAYNLGLVEYFSHTAVKP